MLYVNSRQLTDELFERRSSVYSDRVFTTMMSDLYVFVDLERIPMIAVFYISTALAIVTGM